MTETLLQSYRNNVRLRHPAARLRITPGQGGPDYQIMDGDEPLSDPECSPTIAWREADSLLAAGHLPFCLRTYSDTNQGA